MIDFHFRFTTQKMNYLSLISFAFGILLLASACKTLEQKSIEDQSVVVQTTLDSIVLQNEIPGINFSYINSKNQVQNFSSGYENISIKSILNSSHTMFSGSVGKTYAAAIVFQLVDEGRINYDDKILKHLPKNDWLTRMPNIKEITIRMLLSHTSGLPRWVMKKEVWEILKDEPNKVWSYKERFLHVFNEDALHTAGQEWAYSDTNYLLLGYLIESILKKDYYDVLNERILIPYKLKSTYPSISRKIENMSFAYSEMPASFHVPNEVIDSQGQYVFNPQFEWTGGGLASTCSDLSKWVKIYYSSDIISDVQRANMIQIHETGKNVYGEIHSYGMGTFIYETKYGKAYGHSGFMPGYNTIIAYFPEHDLSCAIQINCDYASNKMKLTKYLEKCIEGLVENVNGDDS